MEFLLDLNCLIIHIQEEVVLANAIAIIIFRAEIIQLQDYAIFDGEIFIIIQWSFVRAAYADERLTFSKSASSYSISFLLMKRPTAIAIRIVS